jgi:Kef-type K+ transport system membrane component KefB
MIDILSFLIVIAAGLFFAEFFKPIHMPYVVGLILTGMLIGPFGLNIFVPDQTLEFMGEIGLVFLMFMAGLETRLSAMSKIQDGVGLLSFINSLFPFLIGLGIALAMGFDLVTALFLGAIFISSSIAVIVPSLERNRLMGNKLGKTILGATIVEDVLSLVVFSILLQAVSPTSNVPLPLFYAIIFLFLLFLRAFILELRKYYMKRLRRRKDIFEREVRFVFAVLIGTVFLFELLGLHAIIAGFFAGMALSESIKRNVLKKKLHALSYGLFIPIFFVLIGSKTDIGALGAGSDIIVLVAAIVIGSICSKFLSGFVAGRLSGFSNKESSLIGASTTPQLSTTLAVAFTGFALGILSQQMLIALTALSIATALAGPFMINRLADELKAQPKV